MPPSKTGKPARQKLVVASENAGKCREIRRILVEFEVLSLVDFSPFAFPEGGDDYFENARVKAKYAARETGLMCVADDSGLEVDALGGAPGAYSARSVLRIPCTAPWSDPSSRAPSRVAAL